MFGARRVRKYFTDRLMFHDWLKTELEKKPTISFDCSGNSSRAVVLRAKKSIASSIRFESRAVFNDVVRELKSFDGWSTQIVWFINVLSIPLVLLIGIPVRCVIRYKMAIDDFKVDYRRVKR